MYPSVQAFFRPFSEKFEGSVSYMYLDILGLVTVGVGNLIDPLKLATALPFRFKNRPGIAAPGTAASLDQIAAEWQRLKSDTLLAKQGAKACDAVTELELDDDAINTLIGAQLSSNEGILKARTPFAGYDTWPADAQLGLLSMAWALGPAGPARFPRFSAACQRLDFATAAAECGLNETGNPGLVPRNAA